MSEDGRMLFIVVAEVITRGATAHATAQSAAGRHMRLATDSAES